MGRTEGQGRRHRDGDPRAGQAQASRVLDRDGGEVCGVAPSMCPAPYGVRGAASPIVSSDPVIWLTDVYSVVCWARPGDTAVTRPSPWPHGTYT